MELALHLLRFHLLELEFSNDGLIDVDISAISFLTYFKFRGFHYMRIKSINLMILSAGFKYYTQNKMPAFGKFSNMLYKRDIIPTFSIWAG